MILGTELNCSCLILQVATQRSWKRPYGVGLLVGGYDATGAHLYYTCPSGNYFEYKAMAMGARSQVCLEGWKLMCSILERNVERTSELLALEMHPTFGSIIWRCVRWVLGISTWLVSLTETTSCTTRDQIHNTTLSKLCYQKC